VERERWAQKIAHWQERLSGYKLDDAFELARLAIAGRYGKPQETLNDR
jgi:hypothetical protein